jgi:hypothetical protein
MGECFDGQSLAGMDEVGEETRRGHEGFGQVTVALK